MRRGVWLTGTVILVAALAVLGFRWAERDGRFDLVRVRVDNPGPVDSALVADILEPCFGVPLLSLEADSIEADLMRIEGLKSVSVTMHFPGTMVVSMVPEQPAAMVVREDRSYPVNLDGLPLPDRWNDGTLPVIRIEGLPDETFVASGIDLLVKRRLAGSVDVTVGEQGIAVRDSDTLILMNGWSAGSDWTTWVSLKNLMGGSGCTVDLRYAGQAIVRFEEEAGV